MELRKYRERARLTQFELAEKVEVSIQTIQRYEKGTRHPRAPDIIKLCEVLQVSEAELLNGPPEGGDEGIRVTLVMNMEPMRGGVIDMKDNEFTLCMEGDKIGIIGMSDMNDETDVEKFIAKVRAKIAVGFKAREFEKTAAV